ncbi:hypothetical protein [Citromicrobium sp. JLT1363]|uniref:hypothetical protein n=1 Tax=Citromicrobium sp. JLT1363 TaxID=517722 RepID=UPI000225DEFC|nr:hypothetical protein [Citromicrobium sp. JLT1363]
MRAYAFRIVDALPSKIAGGLAFFAPIYASAKPDEASSLLDYAMSAETIARYSPFAVLIAALYWLLWLALKRYTSVASNRGKDVRLGKGSVASGELPDQLKMGDGSVVVLPDSKGSMKYLQGAAFGWNASASGKATAVGRGARSNANKKE